MTKRKAIELALCCWNKVRKEDGFTAVEVEDVIVGAAVERAYDLGLAAGMLKAERALRFAYPESLCHLDIRNHANQLAKKARAK